MSNDAGNSFLIIALCIIFPPLIGFIITWYTIGAVLYMISKGMVAISNMKNPLTWFVDQFDVKCTFDINDSNSVRTERVVKLIVGMMMLLSIAILILLSK